MTEEVGTAGLGPPWTEDIRRPPRLPGRWRQSRTDDSGQFGATDTALGPRPAPEGRHRHSTYPRARRSLRRPTWMDPSRASQKFEGLVKWKAGSVNWQGVVIGPQT